MIEAQLFQVYCVLFGIYCNLKSWSRKRASTFIVIEHEIT